MRERRPFIASLKRRKHKDKIKRKRKRVDSRLKISGMTKKGVIPECIYQESK